MAGLLSRERTVAKPGFNRWLVPPAALAIHLSIGMAYGFSVFWLPLSRALGVTEPAPGDWKISTLGWMFTLFFVFLGSSAAVFGPWVERVGPRKTGVVAALCWSSGFFISALGIYVHEIWLLWLGSGVIGGCGLGLGYISPVSTLIKWFPDRRGMATGMAIMGFGGGAMIGAPLADILMKHFATPTSVGVWQTFVTLGLIYLIAMLGGAFGYRVPPPDWAPAGWMPKPQQRAMITSRHAHVSQASRSPQFWLLWMVLTMNVSAGIGVIGIASPMIQEIFGGRLIGVPGTLQQLTSEQKAQLASIGAGFAALLSLFNIGGRIGWASFSDYMGRKRTYSIFFALGLALLLAGTLCRPHRECRPVCPDFLHHSDDVRRWVSTIPAYLADIFGTQYVGAIHGRLLTAWSTAGVLGPVLVNYIREYQIERGVPNAQAYNVTMYVLAGLLVVGLICNLMVKPLDERYYMTTDELANARLAQAGR